MADRSAPDRRFPRARSLKRRRLIRPLFDRSRGDVGRVAHGVVVVLWRLVPRAETGADEPVQVGFAPGRRARIHVGRNRLRRLMRETYRRHQGPLRAGVPDGQALTAMVLFRGREATAAEDLRRDLPAALDRLARRLAPDTPSPERP